jgi:alpha-tubulin suppressor-like RCC1 family protein
MIVLEIEKVLAGRGHCMALSSAYLCFGFCASVSAYVVVVVAEKGVVLSWGTCELGQRGHGVDGDGQELWLASRVEPLCSPPAPAAVVELAVGLDHNVARTADGRLLAWGYGDEGQLGLGQDQLMLNVPTPLDAPRLKG